MPYRIVKRYARKDGTAVWRVFFVDNSAKKPKQRHIPQSEYPTIGLSTDMSFEKAKERVKQLGAIARLEAEDRKRNKIATRLRENETIVSAYLPPNLCAEFEQHMLDTVCWGERNQHYKQLMVYWRVIRKMIADLAISPNQWAERRNQFYKYFLDRNWSLSYAIKLVRVLNLYGKHYAKSTNTFFEEVPRPTREAAVRINESFFQKKPDGHQSAPLSWQRLQSERHNFKPEQWNWLYLSLWFGLRPSELADLKWKVEESSGQKLLAVYQNKLYRLPHDQRWKFIPILFPEQEEGLKILQAKAFSKPVLKTIHKHLGDRFSLRAGRKGFVALMWEQGKYPKDLVFRWLGHKSVKTTDSHYTQALQQALEFDRKKAS